MSSSILAREYREPTDRKSHLYYPYKNKILEIRFIMLVDQRDISRQKIS